MVRVITQEIDKKKKVNNKIVIKSKNLLWDENEKLKDEINDFGYESNPIKYYVEEKQEFGVTLMLGQSCTTLTKNIEKTINELINNIKYILCQKGIFFCGIIGTYK